MAVCESHPLKVLNFFSGGKKQTGSPSKRGRGRSARNPSPRTALGKLRRSATELMQEALQKALQSTGLQMKADSSEGGKGGRAGSSPFSLFFFGGHFWIRKAG